MEYSILMIRVALGFLYLSHSLVMWTLFGFDHAAHYFISKALPASMAYILAAGELLGAVMLLMGVYVRPVAPCCRWLSGPASCCTSVPASARAWVTARTWLAVS
jgi:putative oxidoreductase